MPIIKKNLSQNSYCTTLYYATKFDKDNLPKWVTDKTTYKDRQLVYPEHQRFDYYPFKYADDINSDKFTLLTFNIIDDGQHASYPVESDKKHIRKPVNGDWIIRGSGGGFCYLVEPSDFERIFHISEISSSKGEYFAYQVVGLNLDRVMHSRLPFTKMEEGYDFAHCYCGDILDKDASLLTTKMSEASKFNNIGLLMSEYDDYETPFRITEKNIMYDKYRLLSEDELT